MANSLVIYAKARAFKTRAINSRPRQNPRPRPDNPNAEAKKFGLKPKNEARESHPWCNDCVLFRQRVFNKPGGKFNNTAALKHVLTVCHLICGFHLK